MIITGITFFLATLAYSYRKKVVAYVLDKYQELQLLQLHPNFRERFRQLIVEIEKKGYKVIITSSYRSFSKQQSLYKENKLNAQPGLSHHNYGFAIDIVIDKNGYRWTNQDEFLKSKVKSKVKYSKEDWLATGIPQLAKSLGFQWGGEIPGYYDPVHFNIPADVKHLQRLAISQFGPDVTKIQGNKVLIA